MRPRVSLQTESGELGDHDFHMQREARENGQSVHTEHTMFVCTHSKQIVLRSTISVTTTRVGEEKDGGDGQGEDKRVETRPFGLLHVSSPKTLVSLALALPKAVESRSEPA